MCKQHVTVYKSWECEWRPYFILPKEELCNTFFMFTCVRTSIPSYFPYIFCNSIVFHEVFELCNFFILPLFRFFKFMIFSCFLQGVPSFPSTKWADNDNVLYIYTGWTLFEQVTIKKCINIKISNEIIIIKEKAHEYIWLSIKRNWMSTIVCYFIIYKLPGKIKIG